MKYDECMKQTIVGVIEERKQSDNVEALATFDKIIQGRCATDAFE